MPAGSGFDRRFVFRDSWWQPVLLEGCTAKAEFFERPGDTLALLTVATDDATGRLVFADSFAGLRLSLPAALTESLSGKRGGYAITITPSVGEPWRPIEGRFSFVPVGYSAWGCAR